MKKPYLFKFSTFLVQIIILTIVLFFIHYTIIRLFFKDSSSLFDITKIYLFLLVTVTAFVYLLVGRSKKKEGKILQSFLILSIIKMLLVIVFLLPLFIEKTDNIRASVANFFIPYFLYLIFEISYSLKLLNIKK